jgi:2-isopropylmalate synthase
LETEFGYQLPKSLQKELGRIVNAVSDEKGTELEAEEIHDLFLKTYVFRTGAVSLQAFRAIERGEQVRIEADLLLQGQPITIQGSGNGPIAAFVHALGQTNLPPVEIQSYSEHSLGAGADARAVSYIEIKTASRTYFGVGSDTNIELASIHAIISALNRALA